MIRLATEEDIPQLVQMGLNFRGSTSYEKFLRENPNQMRRLATDLVASKGMLVSEKDGELIGMLGFYLYAHFISGEQVAGEVVWWTDPAHRGDGIRLLKEFERIAKERGAVKIQMVAPTEQVANVYEHFGYEFVEMAYQKSA